MAQQYHNPWEDFVDYSASRILYWGDAKFDETRREKKHDEFTGNRILEKIHELILLQNFKLVPPILHFVKQRRGWIKFSGLCVMDHLETTWYEDKGNPISNFRCHLSILDIEEVPLEWLHHRALAKNIESLNNQCPLVWNDYIKKNTRKLFLWKNFMRSTESQIPAKGSTDEAILHQIVKLSPEEFERFCKHLLEKIADITGIRHNVKETRLVRDGGFDFLGEFVLPYPLHYEIRFKGQAKRYAKKTAVRPNDISRLAARLQRGEYGIFITTSYYTQDAQKEVFQDDYPVKLFSGIDIVNFLRQLGLIKNKSLINEEWLNQVKKT